MKVVLNLREPENCVDCEFSTYHYASRDSGRTWCCELRRRRENADSRRFKSTEIGSDSNAERIPTWCPIMEGVRG